MSSLANRWCLRRLLEIFCIKGGQCWICLPRDNTQVDLRPQAHPTELGVDASRPEELVYHSETTCALLNEKIRESRRDEMLRCILKVD